jgi:hypothetical protein
MVNFYDEATNTVNITLHRGTSNESSVDDIYELSWWTLNPDYAASYGDIVVSRDFNLPVAKRYDWFGDDAFELVFNHKFIHGRAGEIYETSHALTLPKQEVLAISVADSTMFLIGMVDHIHFAIGKKWFI